MFDWNKSLSSCFQSPWQWSGDGENSSFGERRTHGLRTDTAWKSKTLVKTLGGETPAVRGLLLMLRLNDHVVIHGLDHELLRLKVFHIDQYFVLVVFIHHPRPPVLFIKKATNINNKQWIKLKPIREVLCLYNTFLISVD